MVIPFCICLAYYSFPFKQSNNELTQLPSAACPPYIDISLPAGFSFDLNLHGFALPLASELNSHTFRFNGRGEQKGDREKCTPPVSFFFKKNIPKDNHGKLKVGTSSDSNHILCLIWEWQWNKTI